MLGCVVHYKLHPTTIIRSTSVGAVCGSAPT